MRRDAEQALEDLAEEVRLARVAGDTSHLLLNFDRLRALPDRVVPVLHAQVPPEQRVEGAGNVPGGEHVGVGGAQPGVDHDPVVDVEPGGLGERGAGRGADRDQDQVGEQRAPVGQVYVAVAGPVSRAAGEDRPVLVAELELRGDRSAIRAQTTRAVFRLLLDAVRGDDDDRAAAGQGATDRRGGPVSGAEI